MTRFGKSVILAALTAGIFVSIPAAPQKTQNDVAPQGDAIPDGFRGRITYSGTHEGQITSPGRPPRRLSVREIARAGGSTRQHGGAYTLVLDIDGNALRGRYSGTGGITTGTVSGTRHGTSCRLIDDRYGTITEAHCTRTGFTGEARLPEGSRERMTIRIEAKATQFVDAVEEERRQAVASAEGEAERRRRAAEAQRQAEVEAARLRAAPRATPAQVTLLERAVRQDLPGWGNYSLDAGSLRDVRVIQRSGTTLQLRGNYSFNGGAMGWVRAEVAGGQVTCLQYSDTLGCNPPRRAVADRTRSLGDRPSGRRITEVRQVTQCIAEQGIIEEQEATVSRDLYQPVIGETRGKYIPGEVLQLYAYRNTCSRPVNFSMSCRQGMAGIYTFGAIRNYTVQPGAAVENRGGQCIYIEEKN